MSMYRCTNDIDINAPLVINIFLIGTQTFSIKQDREIF